MSIEDKSNERGGFSLRSVFVSIAFAAFAFTLFGIANSLRQRPYDEELGIVCGGIDILAMLALVACCMTPVISAVHRNDRRKGTANTRTCVIILIWFGAIPFILFVGPLIDWLFR
jgi:hypothetical protein